MSESIVPIVEPELFDRVYAKLEGPQKRNTVYKKLNPDFLLRGLLYCKKGHRLTGSAPRGNGGRYPKYHCPGCPGEGISYDRNAVDEQFYSFLDGYSYDASLQEALTTAVRLNWQEREQGNKKIVKNLQKRLLALDTENDEIARKNIHRIFSDEQTKKLLAANALEQANIRLQLNELTEVDQALEAIVDTGCASLQHIGDLWQEITDVDVKQRFQKWAFPAGLVYDGQKFGTSRTALCLSIKKDLSEEKSLVVNHRTSQFETLFEVLEDIDPKLKTLGVVETDGNIVYVAGGAYNK